MLASAHDLSGPKQHHCPLFRGDPAPLLKRGLGSPDGQVDLIAPEANRQKATVQVRVKILKPDELLRPEMNASVTFLAAAGSATAPAKPTVVVPLTAIRENSVFVVAGDRVARRKVEVGGALGKGVSIKSGLAAGDQVVVTPPEGLTDGSRIVVENAQ